MISSDFLTNIYLLQKLPKKLNHKHWELNKMETYLKSNVF